MTQHVCFGAGAVQRLARILDRLGATRVFLVTGGESYRTSGAEDAVSRQLEGRDVHRFSGFSENPKAEDVARGIAAIAAQPFDVVVAVGGGSVLDMGKLVNALARQGIGPVEFIQSGRSITGRGLPMVAIPTTAGSGSEATHFGVVYLDRVKYSLASPCMLPETVIVDPELTYTLPPSVTAASGLDALSQAIESFWCVHSTDGSKTWASRAIRLALDNLATAVTSPKPAVRRAMCKAAHLAGHAINVTRTTGAHALSYPLTSYFGIPHGHAVALTLGEFFVWNSAVSDSDVTDPRGAGYVRETMRELAQIMGCRDAEGCRARIRELMQAIGLESDLSALGISCKDAIDIVVRNVNIERLVNNPRVMRTSELEALVGAIC